MKIAYNDEIETNGMSACWASPFLASSKKTRTIPNMMGHEASYRSFVHAMSACWASPFLASSKKTRTIPNTMGHEASYQSFVYICLYIVSSVHLNRRTFYLPRVQRKE